MPPTTSESHLCERCGAPASGLVSIAGITIERVCDTCRREVCREGLASIIASNPAAARALEDARLSVELARLAREPGPPSAQLLEFRRRARLRRAS